jgi:hypothetical protein
MNKRKEHAGFMVFIGLLFAALFLTAARDDIQEKKIKTIIVDDFEKGSIWNSLDNQSGTFQKEPSFCSVELGENKSGIQGFETSGHFLILDYGRCTKGGPEDAGGWCGWYTMLKTGDNIYLDLTGYNYIRFTCKPLNGGEDFIVGMADKKWDLMEDSVKLKNPVRTYVTQKFKSGWLELTIPLSDFEGLDFDRMSSFVLIFEPGKGTVYMDNITIGSDVKYAIPTD